MNKKKVLLLELYVDRSPLGLRSIANYAQYDKKIKENYFFKLIEFVSTSFFSDITSGKDIITFDTSNTDTILGQINDFSPDIICMSIWYWNYQHVEFLSKEIKKRFPNTPIVLGGMGVFFPEQFLEKNKQFYIYCYEKKGEEIFIDILYHFLNDKSLTEIDGIYYWFNENLIKTKKSDKVVKKENLHGIFKNFPFTNEGSLCYEIIRGCKRKCPYCSWGGDQYILKDLDESIKEINDLPDNANVNFIDSSIATANHSCVFSNIKKTFTSILVNVDCINISNHEKLFEALKDFNCVVICIGVQSFNSKVLKILNRNIDRDVLEFWKNKSKSNSNIYIALQLIYGLPDQTLAAVFEDIRIGCQYGPLNLFNLLVLPNSGFWDNPSSNLNFVKKYPFNLLNSNVISEIEMKELIRPLYKLTLSCSKDLEQNYRVTENIIAEIKEKLKD